MPNKQLNIIFIVIAAIIIVVVILAVYSVGKKQGPGDLNIEKAVQKPLEEMPETVNPFEKVVNPFKDAYKNPFE